MGGSVIHGTSTTMQLDHPKAKVEPDWHERGFGRDPRYASLLKVYSPGTSDDVAVVIDLQESGSALPNRIAFAAMTRDEAQNLIRGIQRALGINPDEAARS